MEILPPLRLCTNWRKRLKPLVSRNLERVADLTTNIAEEVIFLAEAQVVKHNLQDAG